MEIIDIHAAYVVNGVYHEIVSVMDAEGKISRAHFTREWSQTRS